MLTIKIEGAKEVANAFNKLQSSVQNKILKQAIKESGQIVIEAAKNSVPIRTGALYAALELKVSIRKGNAKAVINTKTIEKIATTLKTDKRRKWKKYDHTFYAKFVELGAPGHGVAAQPFLRPALYENHDKMHNMFITAMNDAIIENEMREWRT